MKHSGRVLMALVHQESDRCTMQVGFTPEFAAPPRAHTTVPKPELVVRESSMRAG